MLKMLGNLHEKDKIVATQSLIAHSSPSPYYFFMITLSVLMATFGFLLNSITIIIGSMLIAPMLYPMLSLALGFIISDTKLISRSSVTLLKSILISIGFGLIAALFFGSLAINDPANDLASQITPSIIYFCVSIIAGLAATFSLVKPNTSETLPGVAISVSLIPPLSVIAIGIVRLDWSIVSSASILFLVNVLGIVLASMISFSLMQFLKERRIADKCVDDECKELENEAK